MDNDLGPAAEIPEQPPPAKSSANLKRWILVLFALSLITVAVLSASVYFAFNYIRTAIQSTSSIVFRPEEPTLNQIAFVGNDRNIWLVSPDGENLRPVTKDGRGYQFPTWSSDGRRLAFTGRGNQSIPALYVSSTTLIEPEIVFQQPASAPFYLYWAPNSSSLTFLTQEDDGLAMRLIDVRLSEANRTIAEGNPFYWVWSPDSEKLLMHVGGARSLSRDAYISILDNRLNANQAQLDLAPGRFQAPAWSADGSHIYYIAANEEGRESIFRADANNLAETAVTELEGFTFMVLSPSGQQLAYLQLESGMPAPFGKAYLVGVDGSGQKELAEFPVASLYWAPDSTKLAMLAPARPNEGPTAKVDGLAAPLRQLPHLRWWIYDLENESLEPLTSFTPTPAFLQIVPFFDQYHLSLTFWSPDSRYFVISKGDTETRTGTVWVYDTSGEETALQVGEGMLAVWSWQ